MEKKFLPAPKQDQASGLAARGEEQRYDVGGIVFLVTPVHNPDGESIAAILKKLLATGI